MNTNPNGSPKVNNKFERLFFIRFFSSGSKVMLMEMSPLLYDFAIDVSKQVSLSL